MSVNKFDDFYSKRPVIELMDKLANARVTPSVMDKEWYDGLISHLKNRDLPDDEKESMQVILTSDIESLKKQLEIKKAGHRIENKPVSSSTGIHKMIHCASCNGDFETYKNETELGKCPHCGSWITFICRNCSELINAEAYIKNNYQCPGCNKSIPLPGADLLVYRNVGRQAGRLVNWVISFIVGLVIIALINRC